MSRTLLIYKVITDKGSMYKNVQEGKEPLKGPDLSKDSRKFGVVTK